MKTLNDASPIFRVFTTCQGDPKTLLLDLRPQKQFQKLHIALSYSIRLSANGRALLVRCGACCTPKALSHGPVSPATSSL